MHRANPYPIFHKEEIAKMQEVLDKAKRSWPTEIMLTWDEGTRLLEEIHRLKDKCAGYAKHCGNEIARLKLRITELEEANLSQSHHIEHLLQGGHPDNPEA
jgi:hypothetical protein